MTNWEHLRWLHEICHFQSRERPGEASNSELKRWFERKSVVINGERASWSDPIPEKFESYVLFPKKRRVTLW